MVDGGIFGFAVVRIVCFSSIARDVGCVVDSAAIGQTIIRLDLYPDTGAFTSIQGTERTSNQPTTLHTQRRSTHKGGADRHAVGDDDVVGGGGPGVGNGDLVQDVFTRIDGVHQVVFLDGQIDGGGHGSIFGGDIVTGIGVLLIAGDTGRVIDRSDAIIIVNLEGHHNRSGGVSEDGSQETGATLGAVLTHKVGVGDADTLDRRPGRNQFQHADIGRNFRTIIGNR